VQYDDMVQRLEADHAFLAPNDGLPRFSRARARYRFEPEGLAPASGLAP
jgi:hypothetical protein